MEIGTHTPTITEIVVYVLYVGGKFKVLSFQASQERTYLFTQYIGYRSSLLRNHPLRNSRKWIRRLLFRVLVESIEVQPSLYPSSLPLSKPGV